MAWAREYRNPAIHPLFGLPPAKPAGGAPTVVPARGTRDAIAKALASSQGAAAKFLALGGCVCCHAQHLNGLAVAAAKPLGIQADYELEAREARATATLRGAIEQQLFQVQDPPPGVDSQEISLMQMAASGIPPNLCRETARRSR